MTKWIGMVAALLVTIAAQAAQSLPQEVEINGVEFVQIPGGWVHHPVPDVDPVSGQTRGSGVREPKVWVDTYYLAKYEARARDFARFMNSGQAKHAQQYDPDGRRPHDGATEGCSVRKDQAGSYYLLMPQMDLPATHLSWDLANEFSGWMGFRLATEAEWVRAFRGDDQRIYPWGEDYPDDTYAGFQEGATECDVRPVTNYPKGRSPFGVFNMAGNVFEYVQDWYNLDFYGQLKDGERNPVSMVPRPLPDDPSKPLRTLRGGRWASGVSELNIYGNRDVQPSNEAFRCYGARFAIDAAMVERLLASGGASAR